MRFRASPPCHEGHYCAHHRVVWLAKVLVARGLWAERHRTDGKDGLHCASLAGAAGYKSGRMEAWVCRETRVAAVRLPLETVMEAIVDSGYRPGVLRSR